MLKYKVFVINLARSTDRLKKISSQLDAVNVPFERIEAVEGKLLSDEEIETCSPAHLVQKNYYRHLNKGEVGCSLSHKKAWQAIIDEQLDFAVVLEDDASLESNFLDTLELLKSLPDIGWDYIKMYPLTRKGAKNINKSYDYKDHQFVTYKKLPLGATAQAISLRGAKALIKNMPYVTQPVDGHLKSWWTLNIYPFGLTPYCISVDENNISDINPIGDLETIKQNRLTKLYLKCNLSVNRFFMDKKLTSKFNQFCKGLQ